MEKFKNILYKVLIVLFIVCCLPVLAANWQEIAYKTYIDWSTYVNLGNGHKIFWVKTLNPGNWEIKNGKKIWYTMQKIDFICGQRKYQLIESIDYDLKGSVLSNWTNDYGVYWDVVPGTIGEEKYLGVCAY